MGRGLVDRLWKGIDRGHHGDAPWGYYPEGAGGHSNESRKAHRPTRVSNGNP